MSDQIKLQTCDVCGEPATNVSIDLKQIYNLNYKQYEPLDKKHYGCSKHPATCKIYDLDGNIALPPYYYDNQPKIYNMPSGKTEI